MNEFNVLDLSLGRGCRTPRRDACRASSRRAPAGSAARRPSTPCARARPSTSTRTRAALTRRSRDPPRTPARSAEVFDDDGRAPRRRPSSTARGRLLALREDVGRHNAVDKVIGWALRGGRLPLRGTILLVSGRASFEFVQKAGMAGVPALLCRVGAVIARRRFGRGVGLTLVGFLRPLDGRLRRPERISRRGPSLRRDDSSDLSTRTTIDFDVGVLLPIAVESSGHEHVGLGEIRRGAAPRQSIRHDAEASRRAARRRPRRRRGRRGRHRAGRARPCRPVDEDHATPAVDAAVAVVEAVDRRVELIVGAERLEQQVARAAPRRRQAGCTVKRACPGRGRERARVPWRRAGSMKPARLARTRASKSSKPGTTRSMRSRMTA